MWWELGEQGEEQLGVRLPGEAGAGRSWLGLVGNLRILILPEGSWEGAVNREQAVGSDTHFHS